jgi:ketosteroid isomerase-like protein
VATNADVVREMYGRLERQDAEGMIALGAPDFEFDMSSNVFNPAVWKGREGFLTWFEQASEVWEPPRITILSLEEVDDERVFTAILVENVGRESGAATTMPFWQLWTLRDGLVTRVVHFTEERTAREAAGLAS